MATVFFVMISRVGARWIVARYFDGIFCDAAQIGVPRPAGESLAAVVGYRSEANDTLGLVPTSTRLDAKQINAISSLSRINKHTSHQ